MFQVSTSEGLGDPAVSPEGSLLGKRCVLNIIGSIELTLRSGGFSIHLSVPCNQIMEGGY